MFLFDLLLCFGELMRLPGVDAAHGFTSERWEKISTGGRRTVEERGGGRTRGRGKERIRGRGKGRVRGRSGRRARGRGKGKVRGRRGRRAGGKG